MPEFCKFCITEDFRPDEKYCTKEGSQTTAESNAADAQQRKKFPANLLSLEIISQRKAYSKRNTTII